ncbi:MAG: AtpZ/AtpI family protein [Candidatus Brennerbacteria bacterium]|nr:AtpZ/AtpI family protein [Candidatus Brennerbacteria bacterium]
MRSDFRPLVLAWELGYTIAIPLVGLALLGRFLDKSFGTSPLFLLIGIFVSILVSSFLVYRKTKKIIDNI